jgi:O-antigen/teichoic acid export membrane protein
MSAQVDLTFAVLLVAGAYVGARTFGIQGYAFAVVLSPIVASVPFMFRLGAHRVAWGRVQQGMEGFWSYGLSTAMGAMFGQALFAVDIFMLGRLWVESPDDLAIYRVAWLIPLATQVMPSAVAATDFVRNAAMVGDAAGIRSYVFQYWKSFGLVSLVALSVVAALAPWLLSVFGPGYPRGAQWMQIMLVGVLGAHLLRIPMGNLLSALGRARWNTWTSAAVLVMAGVGCAWRIPSDGLLGAAQVMAVMLWVNGLISLALVQLHIRRIAKS